METWDFQAYDKTLPRQGGWQHPAADFNPKRPGGWPSNYYPVGSTHIVTIVANNTFDNAVTNAANALTPTWQRFRMGGNQRRYNCVDWIVRVLKNAGLTFSNKNPQPFGDNNNVPFWVPSRAIGWALDKR